MRSDQDLTRDELLEEVRALRGRLAQAEDGRRRAEGALRDTEARFRAFMDHSPAVAFIKDEQGRHHYLNAGCRKQFRLGREDVLGKTTFDLFPEEVARRLQRHDAEVFATNRVLETVEVAPTPDGVLRHWLVLKFPFRDASGRRLLGGVAVDVTALRRAEEELRQSHDLLHAVTEGDDAAVFVKDREGRYLLINSAGAAMLGRSVGEVVGRDDDALFPPEAARQIREADQRVMEAGRPETY
jgi:two-component system, sensor histidine kinase and response regulator